MSRTFLGLTFLLAAGLPGADKEPANLKVLLPDARAELTVNGVPTRQAGATRLFVSPPLEPGQDFRYTLTVTWRPNNYTTITRSRKVVVRAGQSLDVDLRQADPALPDKVVVRYVPTPDDVAEAMLKLAGVGKDDVVYDLGCGDGRIVLAAVKKLGAKRGVGVDLDPERIKESKANATRLGVEDKVEFRQGDVLDIKDLSQATVVALYMGEEMNLRLRPVLQKTLKPGSRVVSHRFGMGDWKPDQSVTVKGRDGEEYRLHLWTIREK